MKAIILFTIFQLSIIPIVFSQQDTTTFKYDYDKEMKKIEDKHNQKMIDLEQERKNAFQNYTEQYNQYKSSLKDEYHQFTIAGNPEAAKIVKGEIEYEEEIEKSVNQNTSDSVSSEDNIKTAPVKIIDTSTTNAASIPSGLPFKNQNIRVSSPFTTSRYHPILKKKRPHWGIDYACPIGTALFSTADGIVIIAKKSSSYGYYIVIKHGNYTTTYAHMSKLSVEKGDKVKKGDCIGFSGNTGRSTGAHLHYEIRLNGTPIDPELFN
jgi:murein DD-endopeptidase MepM/ murein hydrolase activator NlpD